MGKKVRMGVVRWAMRKGRDGEGSRRKRKRKGRAGREIFAKGPLI